MGNQAAAGSRGKADRYTGSKSGSMRNRGDGGGRDGGRGPRGDGYRGRGSMHAQQQAGSMISPEDVELRTAENAWKPKRKKSFCRDDPSAFVCERIRGLLNKITPQSFDELVAEFLALIKVK